MEGDLGLSCSVCEEQYSDARVPRNLGCGHSLCTPCASEVLARDKKCPECRRAFSAASASHLPVNYPLLKLARTFGSSASRSPTLSARDYSLVEEQTFTGASADAAATPAESGSRSSVSGVQSLDNGECPTHGARLYFRCMRCNVWVCQQCIAAYHLEPPRGQCRTLPLTQALAEMKRSHLRTSISKIQFAEKLKRRIDKEISALGVLREQRTLTMASLLTALEEVETVTRDVDSHKEAAVRRLVDVEEVLEKLRQTEARMKEATTTDEVSSAVDGARLCLEDVDRCFVREQQLGHSSRVPMIDTLGKKTLCKVLTMGKPVVACWEERGIRLWARVTLRDSLLHLHVLENRDQTPEGLIVPYQTVRQLVPRECPTAFLDVGWTGQVRGRVYVRMFGDTTRSHQFLLLCSGERGPMGDGTEEGERGGSISTPVLSYRHTWFYKLNRRNQSGESLHGGDYERNDGSGGRAIILGIGNGGVYRSEVTAGLVSGWSHEDFWRLAAFKVYLKDAPGSKVDHGFGVVTSGIEILRASAKRMPVTNAKVEDCGLVIPM